MSFIIHHSSFIICEGLYYHPGMTTPSGPSRLTDLLNIRHPIIGGPMYPCSNPELVAAVSNAAGTEGLATSVALGSTTVTAALGAVSGGTTLTVSAAVLQSIDVTPASNALPACHQSG